MYLMSSAMEFYHIADILHSVFIFAQMILLGKQLCRDTPLDQQPFSDAAEQSAQNAQRPIMSYQL